MTQYRLTNDPDMLFCLDTGMFIPRGHRLWPEEWLQTNTPLPIPLPYLPNTSEHYRAIRSAAWDWMQGVVKERGYDTIESCCSYFNSGVERYRLEARAMVSWRDSVNQKLEQLVLNPPEGVVTWEQVKVLLPQPELFNWPEQVELPLDTEGPIAIGD